MKAIDLFAGVGGFRLGLERAGIEVIWSNEFDKYAAQTYNKNFEKKGHKVDERSITDINTNEIPRHDILTAGFPCQAFSIAGKRKGFEEIRGTLFFDIARILTDKRPKYFILENVRGLLNHDGGKTFATILRVCAKIGYDCQWQVLNSKDFGVPQNRERIFIIGHLRKIARSKIFPIKQSQSDIDARNEKGQNRIADTITTRYAGRNARGTHIRRLNNPVHSYPTLKAQSHEHEPMVSKDQLIRRLTPLECERLQGFPDNWTKGVSDTQRYKQMGNAVTVNVVEAIARKLIKEV